MSTVIIYKSQSIAVKIQHALDKIAANDVALE